MLSPAIFAEYHRIAETLVKKYPQLVELEDTIELLVTHSEYYLPQPLAHPVSRDPDDDKFIACAIEAKVTWIISGDRDLLDVGCYQEIKIISPANFVKMHLQNRS